MARKKSHMKWSWIIIISFFLLGIINYRFGILGFVCMGLPMYHAFRGRGKIHCSKYCPRGSFLGKFLDKISRKAVLPVRFRTRKVKHFLLILMVTMLSFSIYHSGLDPNKIAFAMLRFMGTSFVLGILMGIIFKPRSWCQVCPMGHATGLIAESKNKIPLDKIWLREE